MKLNTKGRYAVMAVTDLARHGAERPVSLADIAARQELSLSYLEPRCARLRRAGMVRAGRGPGGGYRLARALAETRIAEIILAVDEPIKATRCNAETRKGCLTQNTRCITHDLWEELSRQIHIFLSSVSVADVLENRVLGRSAPLRPGMEPAFDVDLLIESGRKPERMLAGAYDMSVDRDHNATTPPLPAARAAMAQALETGGNPSSVHAAGRAARRTVEEARAAVAELVCAFPAEVVFTSGGSEANALALRGAAVANGVKAIVASATGHDSILANAADAAASCGARLMHLPATSDGSIDLATLETALAMDGPVLVSVLLANNETGVFQPVKEIAARVRASGGLLHVDAAQVAGRLPVNMRELGADFLTLSAHKMGGVIGAGALVVMDGVRLDRQIAGGGQELGRRAGTENVAAIAAFGAAAAHPADWTKTAILRDRMEAAISAAVPQAVIYGHAAPRLPNTSMFSLAGVAVSSGAACSSGKVKASHVLVAMGASHPGDAIRVSLGPDSREDEIDGFVKAWTRFALNALKRRTAEAA